jgi:hypothetical protein
MSYLFGFTAQSYYPDSKFINEYKIFTDHAEICIINRREITDDITLIIDKESVEKCRLYIWHVDKYMNAISNRKVNNKNMILHLGRYLTNTTDDASVRVYKNIDQFDYRMPNLIIHKIGTKMEKTHKKEK